MGEFLVNEMSESNIAVRVSQGSRMKKEAYYYYQFLYLDPSFFILPLVSMLAFFLIGRMVQQFVQAGSASLVTLNLTIQH